MVTIDILEELEGLKKDFDNFAHYYSRRFKLLEQLVEAKNMEEITLGAMAVSKVKIDE